MYMLRETGSKGESGAAEAVITALFGAADDQQDGTLQENELVTFMRMYKYYCYTFTTTKGPVEGEERLVSDRAYCVITSGDMPCGKMLRLRGFHSGLPSGHHASFLTTQILPSRRAMGERATRV